MDTTKLIKIFAILEVCLAVMYLTLSFYLESHLPFLLQEYIAHEMESEINTKDIIFLWVGIPVLAVHVVSVVGLLLTKVWAKNLYVLGSVFSIVLVPFIGPTVDHAFSAAISDLSLLVAGAILTFLFFTNSAFNKSSSSVGVNAAGS